MTRMDEGLKRSYEPVNIKNHEGLQALFQAEGVKVRRKAETLARKPKPGEIGHKMTTYVKKSQAQFAEMQSKGYSDEFHVVDDGVIVVESRSPITRESVISRNPQPLGIINGQIIYNEWPQRLETWLKNYEVEPGEEFKAFKKVATVRVLKIDERVMNLLCNDPNAAHATIAVDWGDGNMEVYRGGYVTDTGYGLDPAEFEKTYEVVED